MSSLLASASESDIKSNELKMSNAITFVRVDESALELHQLVFKTVLSIPLLADIFDPFLVDSSHKGTTKIPIWLTTGSILRKMAFDREFSTEPKR